MIKLAVDCMGSDNGPVAICEAINNFLKNNEGVYIFACGDENSLSSLKNNDRVKIIPSTQIVPMECGAMQVMRLKDSSMMKAIECYDKEHVDAVVSAGSTGGFLSLATLKLKLIPGIERAALVSPFPTKTGKPVTILDIGASNENTPSQLVQFAAMGKLYSQRVLKIDKPNVYLLSNGTEDKKGSPVSKEAFKLLKESNFEGFKGNIEAREVLSGEADVIVSEGFTGNVFLKATEGAAKMMSGMIKEAFYRNLSSKIGYLLAKKGFDEMKEIMNYKNFGGAMLLGVNGVVVKAHGNSDAYAFEKALDLALRMAKTNIVEDIKEGIRNGL